MIVPKYEIRPAPYSAGKGVFLLEPVKKGQVLVAPDASNKVYNKQQREALPVRRRLLGGVRRLTVGLLTMHG